MRKLFPILLLVLSIVLLVVSSVRSNQNGYLLTQFENRAQQFDKKLVSVQKKLDRQLTSYLTNYKKDSILPDFSDQSSEKGFAYFLHRDSNLLAWSSNNLIVPEYYVVEEGVKYFVNGYYLFDTLHCEGMILTGVFQIKEEYQVENSVLQNKFHPIFNLDESFFLSVKNEGYPFQSLISGSQAPELYLMWRGETQASPEGLVLESLGLALLLIGFYFLIRQLKSWWWYLSVVVLMVLIRYLFMQVEVLININTLSIFQPQVYASSDLLPSLGDLSLHLAFLLVMISPTSKKWSGYQKIKSSPNSKYWYPIFAYLLLFAIGVLQYQLLASLVKDSTVNLDLRHFSNYDTDLLLLLVIIFALGVAFSQLLSRVHAVRQELEIKREFFLTNIILIAVLLTIFYTGVFPLPLLSWSWVVPILFLYDYKTSPNSKQVRSLNFWPELLVFSLLMGTLVYQNEKRDLLVDLSREVVQQAEERNLLAEYLIESAGLQLEENADFFNADSVQQQKYLHENQYLQYIPEFDFNLNWEPFSERKFQNPKNYIPIGKNLYQRIQSEALTYQLLLKYNTQLLTISFTSLEIPDNEGFPSVLANKTIEKLILNSSYSAATYTNGQLIRSKGSFHYPISSPFLNLEEDNTIYFKDQNHLHAVYTNKERVYVVSSVNSDLRDFAGIFSSFFFLFLFLNFILSWLKRVVRDRIFVPVNLTSRLQFFMLFVLFSSITFIAVGTVNYMYSQFKNANIQSIEERLQLIASTINNKFEGHCDENQFGELVKFYGVDLMQFGTDGSLLKSSQDKIFDWGVLTEYMDPQALKAIGKRGESVFVQEEEIGRLKYFSGYAPILDQKGEVSSIINIPYFAKTDQINLEIRNFFSTLVNLYLLLTAFSILLGLVLANRIAKPLRLLQEKISGFSFDGKNERIEWHSNDEIGSLVNQYNAMVSELEDSATKLAAAERESAWKEMAQQVAHEIKNPLTPMKLRIQHFKQTYNGMSELERSASIESLSDNLIMQIDTLTSIANEFSNFARLQEANPDQIEIIEFLKGIADVYTLPKSVELTFNSNVKELFLWIDKDHLLRIINNLIQNAIQSFDGQKGRVEIKIQQKASKVYVEIIDNGSGIPEGIRDKIFQPNFTTKSSGMGLGLAMVKRMVQQAGGRISFSTSSQKGTSFRLEFPL